MKRYYLRYTSADFTKTGKTWRTPVIDLYYNSQYKNYSVRKANYGTDLLGNGVYTGINKLSSTASEVGFVESGRFIDTSSRIDLVEWNYSINSTLSTSLFTALSVYNTDSATAIPAYSHATPGLINEWVSRTDLEPNFPLYLTKASRYAYFELNFTTELADISGIDIELLIAVEIEPPVINGYFASTKRMQNKFPEWMDIREYDALDIENATPATPSSVGGQLLNALAGEWLTDLTSKINYQEYQTFIDTADISQKAWAYVAPGLPYPIWSVVGDGIQLATTSNINEFYESNATEDCYHWNVVNNEIYTNRKYSTLLINGVQYYQNPYQIWNAFDDLALHVDLSRIRSATPNGYLEDNQSFKTRILDVYRNQLGVSPEAFKLALRRELNLWRYYGSTPDSDFLGATPSALEMSDIEVDSNYFTEDGIPTERFKDLIEELALKYPTTWGYFRFDKAFWDPDGLLHDGFRTLPKQLDATPVSESMRESGVADGNDLFIFKPQPDNSLINFTTNLKIRGRQRTTRSEYIPLTFNVKIYGRGTNVVYDNPVLTSKFTLELSVTDSGATPASPSSTVYYSNITVTNKNTTNYYDATPSSNIGSLVDWTTPDGYTDISFKFYNKLTGAQYVGQIPLSTVYKVTVRPGHYNGNAATPSYDNATTQSYYKVWFTDDANTIMGNGGGTSLTKNSYNWQVSDGSLVYKSERVNLLGATPNDWQSDAYNYTVTINGSQPNGGIQNFIVNIPPIAFPAAVTSRTHVVEITTKQGFSTYGAYSAQTSATPVFLPSTYLAVNDSSSWTSGYLQSFSTSVTSFIFSSVSGSAYPLTTSVWSLFQSTIPYTVSGTVNQYGPKRYGQLAEVGNTNFMLDTLNLTRDNFSIPNTTDYIVTWLGVDSVSDSRVTTWTTNNLVKPAVKDPGENSLNVTYPETAIVETLNTTTNKYEFNGVQLYARLKPSVNEKWHPKAHSGWFHDDVDEYYLYASPTYEMATNSFFAKGVNRQGAPVLAYGLTNATPEELRQVAFWQGNSTPTMSLTNTETIVGTGSNRLYAGYSNIYGISVFDNTLNTSVSLVSNTTQTNVIQCTTTTYLDHSYTITYTPAKSFYVDNTYMEASPSYSNKMQVVFDKTASSNGYSTYKVFYETSVYDPATPVAIPLNTFHTSIDEGFIFIDHDIKALAQIEVKISPSKLIADGYDYAIVTFRSLDIHGNPKPYQSFKVFANFGTFNKSTVVTDRDGFGYAVLTSQLWSGATPIIPATPALAQATPGGSIQGQILVDGPGTVDTRIGFDIQILPQPGRKLVAVLDSDHIISNGISATSVFGIVEDGNHNPVPAAVVFWKKARNLYELFTSTSRSNSQATPGSARTSGMAITDSKGRFTIGPFISATRPGYWLTSLETEYATPISGSTPTFSPVGDVVYWYEYPNIANTVDPVTKLPVTTVQSATPYWKLPQYTYGSSFPVTYDETNQQPGYQNATPIWTPPKWYAIDKYRQYQMGNYGTQYNIVGATPRYPDYKEF